LINKKKYLEDKLYCDFWYRNAVKCSINIKKTKPTPKSITQRKPVYISASFRNNRKPKDSRYKPPEYKSTRRFMLTV